MIINGGSRSNGRFFSKHLMRADHNERVAVREMRGFAYAEDVPSAFREMRELASGTACKNYFYHADINTRADERLTPAQWEQAADALEAALGLTGQPRLIVEHEKDGRTHQHIVWSRIDADRMTAVSDGHNYRRHELAARALEKAFGQEPTIGPFSREADTPRPERAPKDWEAFRAQESRIDPKAMKAELTELWRHADSGPAFAAALEERGYILAKGDRRDFCVIDAAGDEHSLARRLAGVTAAEVRARMHGVDRDALPSVEEARALARERPDPADGSAPIEPVTTQTVPVLDPPAPAFAAPEAAPPPLSDFEAILEETVREAEATARHTADEEQAGHSNERHAGWRAWLENFRDYAAGWGSIALDWLRELFSHDEPELPATPTQEGQER